MKKRYMFWLTIILLTIFSIILFINFHPVFWSKAKDMNISNNYSNWKFWNLNKNISINTWNWSIWNTLKEYWDNNEERFPLTTVPTIKFDKTQFKSWDFVWLGQSTILINVDWKNMITDPVFNKASPIFLWWKPFHYSAPPKISDLPDIDFLLISHDHYDHLDYQAILELKPKVKIYLVWLWVKAHLESWWIDSDKIIEFDWYDKKQFQDTEIIFTPAQHFSGRGLTDRFSTLWWWWIIKWKNTNIYFSWDTGYYDEFKKIWESYWPFDYAFIENGAYNKAWASIHMMPEEVVQAWIDLKANNIMPIHWWKFDLSLHSWHEPIERFIKEANKKEVSYFHPQVWVIFNNEKLPKNNWWSDLSTK